MTMRRILCLLLIAIFIPIASFAESRADIVRVEGNAKDVSRGIPEYAKYAYSACYLPVTYKTVQGGVVTNEVTYYEKVADIQYKYYINIDSEDRCVGGYIVRTGSWPRVTAESVPHLDMQFQVTETPTGSVTPLNNGADYQVLFYGGTITFTYNAVIYLDMFNVQYDQDADTVTRVFYYTETLPTEQ